jgi:hypothetical protein
MMNISAALGPIVVCCIVFMRMATSLEYCVFSRWISGFAPRVADADTACGHEFGLDRDRDRPGTGAQSEPVGIKRTREDFEQRGKSFTVSEYFTVVLQLFL